MGLQRLLRWLRPRNDRGFSLLLQQAELLEEAALLLATVTDKTCAPQSALEALSQRDQRGEALGRALLGELSRNYLVPFDREDLHDLSTMLQGVLGSLCAAGQALIAYELRSLSPAVHRMIQICIEAAHALHVAVKACSQRQAGWLTARQLQLKVLERSGEAAYQVERVALYRSPQVTAKQVLRQQAMLDALRAAIRKCLLAGNVVERLLVKHA